MSGETHHRRADEGTQDAEAAYASYLNTRFFVNLNGLRFICIAMVLWEHAPPVDVSAIQLFDRGFMGVDFFFVLSGFLITTLLLREARDKGRFSLRNFYIRRALRILPVFLFVVTAIALYYILVKSETQYLKLLPFYYLFLSNFLTEHIPMLAVTWSLSVEEQFYLIWPALLLILPQAARVPVLLVLIAVNVTVSAGLIPVEPYAMGTIVLGLPHSTYAPIFMGSLLAIALDDRRGFAWFWRLLGNRWAALGTAAALVLALQFTPQAVHGWPHLLIHTLMVLMLAALVVRQRSVLTPFLAARPVARIGEISYGIYLYHMVALFFWMRTAGSAGFDAGWLRLIGYSMLSIAMAEISFRTLEAWFRRYRPG